MIAKQKNGLKWYENELLSQLGVKHGFFTSLGGESPAPFDSLNVKFDIDDLDENVDSNRQKILSVLEIEKVQFAPLVHGADIAVVTSNSSEIIDNADSLITKQKNLAIALSVADCLPIVVSDGKIVAVIHAGWRGTVKQIVSKTVEKMVSLGFKPENAVAALGPCICQKHFEVRDEAARLLRAASSEVDISSEPYYADLVAINRQQLEDAGVRAVESLSICSFESDEFYSYRADNGKTGRNMAIALLS
ncbi:peptidoglycan editing factor PgeF [Candidatus Saccharibacteria bacterium]|nr:peptidoglycan editing factor PgeF [Candidatus Saccharibacteria bacterium]